MSTPETDLERELRRTLRDPDGEALVVRDMAERVRAGMVRARRRRRRGTIAAVLASAALVAGVSVVSATTGGGPGPGGGTTGAAEANASLPFPAAPEGSKWVGMNGVVVAVPSAWTVTESKCGSGARSATATASNDEDVYCALRGGMIDSAIFTPFDGSSDPAPDGGCLRPATPRCSDIALFQAQDVSVRVNVTADDAVEQVARILDSAMVLPQGWTTVPFTEGVPLEQRVDSLEEAGFQVEVTDPDRIGRFNVAVTPGLGSPVREGSVIELTPPATDQPLPTEAPPTTAPPTEGVYFPGCREVQVGDVSATGDELTVTLNNDGDTSCDLTDLQAAVTLGGFNLRDQAQAADITAPSTALPAGGTAVLRIETYPGCQFAGHEFTFTLDEGTSLAVLHPREVGNVCIEPAPQMKFSTIEVAGGADPANKDATDLGGAWNVEALVGRDGQSLLAGPHADALTMMFNDGELTGSSGCNSVFGKYVQSGTSGEDVLFPPAALGATLVGCNEPPLLTRLLDVRHVSGKGDVRFLHAANWMIVVELRRS